VNGEKDREGAREESVREGRAEEGMREEGAQERSGTEEGAQDEAGGERKRGVHPAVWIAAGCGAVLVLVAVVVMAVVGVGLFKARDFVGDLRDNPIGAVAAMAIRSDPELEILETDDDAGTITFRNTRTGKVATMNFQDIADGKFSLTTDEGEFTLDAENAAEGGGVTVTGPEGEARFGAGASLDDVPGWVPLYPGAEAAQGTFHAETPEEINGTVAQTSTDTARDVLQHFKQWFADEGYSTTGESITTTPQGSLANIVGEREDEGRTVHVGIIEADGRTRITVSYRATMS
jgi:hypothetical protein